MSLVKARMLFEQWIVGRKQITVGLGTGAVAGKEMLKQLARTDATDRKSARSL